jgi:hypothetical protein
MSADEQLKNFTTSAGTVVAFIGGPEAGRARRVNNEDLGKLIKADGDWIYRIYPFQFPDAPKPIYFAFAANEPGPKLLFAMWEEYSIAAQIRGGDYTTHIQRLKDLDIKSRS